jgi:hypothetical protein
MQRRDVLKRTAALAAAGGLAGCTGGSGDGPDGNGGDGGGGAEDPETDAPDPTATPTPEPQVASSEVLSSEGSCGEGNDASLTVEDGTVRVTGRIPAPDPCYRAELDRSAYDAGADELAVSMTVAQDGGMCQQCVASVEYEAVVRYEGSAPGSVSVAHDVGDGTTQVASSSN